MRFKQIALESRRAILTHVIGAKLPKSSSVGGGWLLLGSCCTCFIHACSSFPRTRLPLSLSLSHVLHGWTDRTWLCADAGNCSHRRASLAAIVSMSPSDIPIKSSKHDSQHGKTVYWGDTLLCAPFRRVLTSLRLFILWLKHPIPGCRYLFHDLRWPPLC